MLVERRGSAKRGRNRLDTSRLAEGFGGVAHAEMDRGRGRPGSPEEGGLVLGTAGGSRGVSGAVETLSEFGEVNAVDVVVVISMVSGDLFGGASATGRVAGFVEAGGEEGEVVAVEDGVVDGVEDLVAEVAVVGKGVAVGIQEFIGKGGQGGIFDDPEAVAEILIPSNFKILNRSKYAMLVLK